MSDSNNKSVVFTRDEVSEHNTENSAWIILNNQVYDVTNFLPDHPGGEAIILSIAGQDATQR